ncbi:dTMP kinase [Paenibacillus sp. IB182496]|uniref:Thymidylate kinase n=1 Tax=Paenibacillus sabuli TaxID=2772509 RepID=A0A927BZ97_9BACL|nr:dTMP kinase [Paenibacillus sabuli]MBD2848335.1 dTMP kinase [Paenibacillus sabuli]
MQGKFITIEGGEGAGKTTLIERLQARMRESGRTVITTREPGGIRIAEAIRAVILEPAYTEMDARTEALLYAAARRQHLVEKVLPALEQGCDVICDRFVDSSLAYQGHARGLGIDEVLQLNSFATEGRQPDLTFWLDLDPALGLKRIMATPGREVNRLDQERLAFHRQVRAGYAALQAREPQRIVRVDAAQPPEAVLAQVIATLERHQAGFLDMNVK